MVANGIIFILNPMKSVLTLVTAIGILLTATGFVRVIRYFTDSFFRKGMFLVGGVVDIVLGVLILKHPTLSVNTLTLFIGFWQLFSGITEIGLSLDLKRYSVSRWWLSLLSGILGTVVGYLFITNRGISAAYISLVAGIYMLFLGVTFVSTFFVFKRRY